MAVAFDSAATGFSANWASSSTWSHNAVAGSWVIGWVVYYDSAANYLATPPTTTLNYGGSTPMRSMGQFPSSSGRFLVEPWFLPNPPVGAQTVSQSNSASPGTMRATTISYTGVKGISVANSTAQTAANISLTAMALTDEMLTMEAATFGSNITGPTGTSRFNKANVTPRVGISDTAGTGPTGQTVGMTAISSESVFVVLRLQAHSQDFFAGVS